MTGPPAARTFDLHSLSDANFRRHRIERALFGLNGCLLLGCTLAGGLLFFLSPNPSLVAAARYLNLAVGALIGYLGLALFWVPVRYWARPPVSISVGPEGLAFSLSSGRRIVIPWAKTSLRIVLLQRALRPPAPPEATFRLWVLWEIQDVARVWRPMVPLTYLTEIAFHQVVDEARRQHLTVRLRESVGSLSHVTIDSSTTYDLRNGWALDGHTRW